MLIITVALVAVIRILWPGSMPALPEITIAPAAAGTLDYGGAPVERGPGRIVGRARVIDGDTLQVGPDRVRLEGIDAVERSQTCGRGGRSWACGEAARQALAERVNGRQITCRISGLDRYGRSLGRCRAGGEDLGGWMVSRGLAVAYRRYSRDYVGHEAVARQARAGVWAGEFELPQAVRHGG